MCKPARRCWRWCREDVWVVANFKETQLTYMRPGQPVNCSVDAYPGPEIQRQSGQPPGRDRRAVQPVAAGKRRGQLRQGRPARAGQNCFRRSVADQPGHRAGHVRRAKSEGEMSDTASTVRQSNGIRAPIRG